MGYAERAAEKSEPHRRGGLPGLGWLCILIVAWVVFDLTASDSLTAVIVCSKLGWDDWLTAIWLLRRAPQRVRAVVCSWFFSASGLWKMTVTAFAVTIALECQIAASTPEACWGGTSDNRQEKCLAAYNRI